MREISLADTKNVKRQKKNPVTVYDTSGPFTDPNLKLTFEKDCPVSANNGF
jgi:phosphomethylpyrimidine synthase